MGKLRLIKNRQDGTPENAPELRGFGDPELFQKTSITPYLMIVHCKNQADLVSTCEAYGLVVDTHPAHRDAFFLRKRISHPEEHKLESVRLFVVALEIQRKQPEISCVIFQLSGLRTLLREKVKNEKQALVDEITELLHHLPRDHSKFALDAGTSLAIGEAGFLPSHTSGGTLATQTWNSLNTSHLNTARTILSKPETTPSNQVTRKKS